MESNQMNSPKHKGRGKDTHFQAKMQKVFVAFTGSTKLKRANACIFSRIDLIDHLKKSGTQNER